MDARSDRDDVATLRDGARQPSGFRLRCGRNPRCTHVASKAKEKVGIDHFCVGIDGFDADKAQHSLATQSPETFTEFGSGVYFYDPDGNKVQVSAPDYQA